ncbi:hypothetical protein [Longispora urticae]
MAEPGEARQAAVINARSVIVAAVVTAVLGGGVTIWNTLRAESSAAPPAGLRRSTPDTAPPAAPPSAAPTAGATTAPPAPSPSPAPVPSPRAPVDRPLVGGACLPGAWRLHRLEGRPKDSNVVLRLFGEGYLMRFDAGGTGTVTMPANGVWYVGQDAGRSVKYRTVGSSTFSWRVADGTVTLTPGTSSLVSTAYLDDVDQGSGPDRLPDRTATFDCSGDSLRLADAESSSDLTRAPAGS